LIAFYKGVLMIFENIERNDHTYSRSSETIYAFLNRSAWPDSGKCRKAIEDFYDCSDESEKADLKSRLLSKDKHQFNSALFEIYLNKLFLNFGSEVEPHPALNNSKEHPEFLIKNKEEEFYLEAVCAEQKEEKPLIQEIQDYLDKKIKNVGFMLSFDVEGDLKSQIKLKTLYDFLNREIEKIDFSRARSDVNYRNNLCFQKEYEQAKLIFKIILMNEGEEYEHTIGRGPIRTFWGSAGTSLESIIERKASKYGTLNKPLILAVSIPIIDSRLTSVSKSFFGTPFANFSKNSEMINQSFNGEGAFIHNGKKKNSKITGVLVFPGFCVFGMHQNTVVYYPNPYAAIPTPKLIDRFNGYTLGEDQFIPRNGLQPFDVIDFKKYE